jgi:hypothetical protein
MNPEEIRIMSLPKMQEKFREAMGELQPGDRGLDKFGCLRCYPHGINNIVIRLPLPIDPVNPERGLWEMVDWKIFNTHLNDDGNIYLWSKDEKWHSGRHSLILALPKALAHQWEVEI